MFRFIKYFKPSSYSVISSFAIKAGVATAAVYYINEQGIWKPSNESVKVYPKIKEVATPYVEQVTAQIPYELPKLPESDVLSSVVKESWNAGVLVTFKFLSDLPYTTKEWTNKGIDMVKQNEEIKKFINSFS
ncbi:MICOS complex subunit MIC13 homolog QIL1 isoform X1 [Diorhabda carinulata]|uniref:MICOS complex subunit MIC13 homolog QIL1 isoform X1 n=1 Tax=Diorhabda carinulata TaxID=1163345 RepID=UPI0025A14D38|nr:MICOS complex subunit MIC13 homolog QIL1 isoform X1 [Diorhabda carinulata]